MYNEFKVKGEKEMKFYNVSFNLNNLNSVLVPAIPESAGTDENKTIPRVCLTDSIGHCMQAIASGNREMCKGTKFIVREVDIPLTKKSLYNPKFLKTTGYVPDALENNEFWSLEPLKFKMYICELEHFDCDFTVSWSCVTREQILGIINRYVKTKRFNRYKTSQGIYNAFCNFISEKTRFATEKMRNYYYNMYDEVWEDIVELPWAQKTELTNIQYKVIKQLY